jgi:hypothetical protein
MCRSIKRLRQHSEIATSEEIRAAALQFVRKVSGFQRPSPRHEQAFDQAVDEIAEAAERLLLRVTASLSSTPAAVGD